MDMAIITLLLRIDAISLHLAQLIISTRNPLLAVVSLAAAAMLQIGIELEEKTTVLAPP
jgi:hypothetical protein